MPLFFPSHFPFSSFVSLIWLWSFPDDQFIVQHECSCIQVISWELISLHSNGNTASFQQHKLLPVTGLTAFQRAIPKVTTGLSQVLQYTNSDILLPSENFYIPGFCHSVASSPVSISYLEISTEVSAEIIKKG